MLPSRSAALYSEVKLASDAALGLPSQVMVAPVAGVGRGAAPRGRLQYCANLGLKINAKLGGVNMRLAGNPDQVGGGGGKKAGCRSLCVVPRPAADVLCMCRACTQLSIFYACRAGTKVALAC
jgi:hypothetical protein